MKAMIRMAPLQRGHTSGSTSYTCLMRLRREPLGLSSGRRLSRAASPGALRGRGGDFTAFLDDRWVFSLRLPAFPPTDDTVPGVVPHEVLARVRDMRRQGGQPVVRREHNELTKATTSYYAGMAGHGVAMPNTTSSRCQHPRLGASGDATAECGIGRYRMKLNGMGSCASRVRRCPSRNVPRETRRCVACSWSPK